MDPLTTPPDALAIALVLGFCGLVLALPSIDRFIKRRREAREARRRNQARPWR